MNQGLIYASLGYIIWGLLPVYWKSLGQVSSLEILCHRMIWSVPFLLIILGLKKRWKWVKEIRRNPRQVRIYLVSALLLSVNWITYVYSVISGRIVESSLGYFINPLIYVVLGMIFLGERLRKFQIVAVFLALIGVIYLTFFYGSFPWIALVLALTFGFYGLIRKTGCLEALEGLTLETAIMFFPAVFVLFLLNVRSGISFAGSNMDLNLLLILAGPATALPLLLFAEGARRISLASLGILQYIAPFLQFLIGILVYQESFNKQRLIGFCLIWIALAIYTAESYKFYKKSIKDVK